MCWRATLVFPGGSSADTVLRLRIEGGNGVPVSDAMFEFAGKSLKVDDGYATITYADFVKGKHDVPLWLHRNGMLPIPGGLTFE